MRRRESLHRDPSPFDRPSTSPTTLGALRDDVRRRLHQEAISLGIIGIAIIADAYLTVTDQLPALHGGDFAPSFLAGFLMGLFVVAGVVTANKIRQLARALASDTELRRLHAREHDELEAHIEREVARTFIHALPVLAVIVIFASALVSTDALLTVAATLVFFSVVLIAMKLGCKARFRADADADDEEE